MPGKKWTVDHLRNWHDVRSSGSYGEHGTGIYLEASYTSFYKELLRKTKLLSQLIATSWLDNDNRAPEIREILRKATADDSDLRKLLTGKNCNLWKEEIFTKEEIELYAFQITWDSFQGVLIEELQAVFDQKPPYFTVKLPCPPRPTLGEVNLTQQQIQEWVNSPLEDSEGKIKPFPPYPYLPTTTA